MIENSCTNIIYYKKGQTKKRKKKRNHKIKPTNQNRKTLNRYLKTNQKMYPPNMQIK